MPVRAPFEGDPPRSVDIDCPASGAIAFERMQTKAGYIEVAQLGRGIERIQPDQAAPPQIGTYPRASTGDEQIVQASMAKAPDHYRV